MNAPWVERFKLFLVEKGYAKNTICSTLSQLKAIIKRWHVEGKMSYDGSGIYTSSEVTTAVYTTIDELQKMLDCDLSSTPGAERVRDIYVMQCFVGLRYSDFAALLDNPALFIRTIGGRLFFEIKTRKTGEVVVIPVAEVVKKILEKYNYDFGTPFSFQYYNLTVKEIARLTGLTEDVVFSRTRGGERVDAPIPKWKLISSHTARRTFATNAFLAGIPERSIMAITGHSTASSFQRYIRCSSLASAVKIAGDDFFHIDFQMTLNLSNKQFELIND